MLNKGRLVARGRLRGARALAVGLLASAATPGVARGACYVAFVHGKREGKPTAAEVKTYWNPDPASTTYSFPYWSAERQGCKTLMVRWNSTQTFVSQARDVASQIVSFVSANKVPAKQLIIVAHSMGGLVSRYILNNTVLMVDGDKILNATKYLITSQTPHLGTKAADSVAFEAGDGVYGAAIGAVARLIAGRNAASDSMRRVEMEYASATGGWMNDVFRSKKIYTIEGWRTGEDAGPNAGVGSDHTGDLDLAWAGLCYKPHAINAHQCGTTYGDGLVEMLSAYGRFSRSGTWAGTRDLDGQPSNYFSNNQSLAACFLSAWPLGQCKSYTRNKYFAGARVRWLQYGGDHQQGAWDLWQAETYDFTTNVAENAYLASYIGRHGLNLPE